MGIPASFEPRPWAYDQGNLTTSRCLVNSRTLASLCCKVLAAIKQTTAPLRCHSLLPPALPCCRPRSLWHSAPCALPRLGSHASCRYLLSAQSLQYVVQLARAANSNTPRWHAVGSGARCHELAHRRGASAAMLQCRAARFHCRAQPPAAARLAAPATGRRQCSAVHICTARVPRRRRLPCRAAMQAK